MDILAIQRFLDDDGRITQLPAKNAVKQQVYAYLAQKFDPHKEYTEKEVNEILVSWHTFGDYFILRRELIDFAWMIRTPDGRSYWVNKEKLPVEEENFTDQP